MIHLLILSLCHPFPPTALRRRHAQTIRDRSSSNKRDYVIVIKNFLNPEDHQNPIDGSKVTAILLKSWILPLGGASAVWGQRSAINGATPSSLEVSSISGKSFKLI